MTPPQRLELPTPFPIGPVNAYLLAGTEPALFDCGVGTEACWNALQQALHEVGVTVSELRFVYISHAHVDHMGLASYLVQNSGAQFLCSPLVATWLEDFEAQWSRRQAFLSRFLPLLGLSAAQLQVMEQSMVFAATLSGSIPANRIQIVPTDGSVNLGGMNWRSIYLPGHANSQCCLYQPNHGLFLAADMLLPKTPTPVIEPAAGTGRLGEDRSLGLPAFLQSLDRLEQLAIECAFPGHGELIWDVQLLIQHQRARIQKRAEECWRYIRSGVQTVAGLLDAMYPHYDLSARFGAVAMVVGYLDLLLADRRIQRTVVDGVWQLTA